MALKVIELEIDESLSGETRVEEIALVLEPAIETQFMWFNQQGFQTIDDYPQYITDNAVRAKKWVDENGYGNCMTPVGKARLNQLAKGEPLSLDTLKRMYSYIARHKQDLETSKDFGDGCGFLAMMSWGEDGSWRTFDWLESKISQIEEMSIDTGNLQPWAQTTGSTMIQNMEDGPCWEGYEMIGWKEKDGVRVPNCVPKEKLSIEDDCGCGCNGDDGLIFGTNLIDGKPVFQTEEEAIQYAEMIGCNGAHPHIIDGKEYYMPCEIHNDTIDKLIEDIGVELEELLASGWTIQDVNVVNDAESIRNEFKKSCENITKQEFYRIVTTPGEYSRMDYGNRTRRYVYMTGMGRAELIDTSREFCRRMLGGRQFVFRIEDIERLSAEISAEPNNLKIIPRPKGSDVDIFAYKGGANCAHYWMEIILQPPTIYDTAPVANNNKRRMIEEAALTIPADGMAGNVNPPVDYGSRSPQSVGMSKQDFRRSESVGIIVDVDDTLVDGTKPIQKVIDYVNSKWETNRIIIVSGRQKSRTEETKRELDRLGVKWDEIHLSDFPVGPNASREFKVYKAKLLQKSGLKIREAIENDGPTRREYDKLGIITKSPSSFSKLIPSGFLQGLAVFEDKIQAKKWSEEMGCNGLIEEVDYMSKKMFQACSYKKQKMSAQFSLDEEKRMLYSPAMKPGILIPRIDETTKEKYFVTFSPETIKIMSQRFLIEKRTDKTNYEHTDHKFDGVYLVESWIVDGEQDKAYALGYKKQDIPKGTWMVGYRIDNNEVWDMIKLGKVKGLSIEGNFEMKLSAIKKDEYLLEAIINIINKIDK